jgi:hypothetical protein
VASLVTLVSSGPISHDKGMLKCKENWYKKSKEGGLKPLSYRLSVEEDIFKSFDKADCERPLAIRISFKRCPTFIIISRV